MQIQWLDYLNANRQAELFDIIRSYNMPLPSDIGELYECVQILIEQRGEEVERKILEIHPDYTGIEKLVLEKNKKVVENYHNFAGESKDNSRVESRLNKIESSFEVDNLRREVESAKRTQFVMMITLGILLYHNFK